MSYKVNIPTKKHLKVYEGYEAESLEHKIQRLVQNKEPMDGTVPLTYTERKDGVKPEYNIKTDRWEIAAEAMDKVTKSHIAKRDAKAKPIEGEKKDGGAEPIGGEN